MDDMQKRLLWLAAALAIIWGALALFTPGARSANYIPDPTLTVEERIARSAWYARQKMPDDPKVSCCGEADAYYADDVEVDAEGNVWAIVTDERDVPNRPKVAAGTKIKVPKYKNKDTRADPNPTGHTIIFLAVNGMTGEATYVWCYLPDGGV